MAFSAPPERHVSLSRVQIARMVFIFAVATFALARTLPDALRIAWPLTVFGYHTDASGKITQVFAGGPAAKAGIKVGDRVDIKDFSPFDRKPGLIGQTYSAYNPIRHITIIHDGVRMAFEIKGVDEALQTRVITLLRELVALITIAIGALLAIVRPNRASLGFFHFVVGGEVYPSALMTTWLDYPWRMLLDGTNDILVSGSLIGLLMFALGFPRDLPTRWRWPVDCAGLALWAVCAGLFMYFDIGAVYFAKDATVQNHLYNIIQTAIGCVTIIVFVVTMLRSKGSDRIRVAWVVIAFMVALLGALAAYDLYPGPLKYWQFSALQLLPILPAVAVFYGVTRYHILGIDFVVNRAIVYAAMTAATVGLIGLAEEGFSYWFVMNSNLAYAIIIAMTIGFGFFFTHIKDFIRGIVDRVMFKDRKTARDRLEAMTHELPHAKNRDRIEYALTSEVQQALGLRCAVLFELRGDRFVVVADAHWPPSASELPGDDPTMMRVVRLGIAEFLRERDWIGWSADLRPVTPRVAVPIEVDVGAPFIAVYGLEVSGVDLDVDEVRALERLATAAAVGFSNLRTRELASHLEELIALREENEYLRTRLAALEGKPVVSTLTETPRPDS